MLIEWYLEIHNYCQGGNLKSNVSPKWPLDGAQIGPHWLAFSRNTYTEFPCEISGEKRSPPHHDPQKAISSKALPRKSLSSTNRTATTPKSFLAKLIWDNLIPNSSPSDYFANFHNFHVNIRYTFPNYNYFISPCTQKLSAESRGGKKRRIENRRMEHFPIMHSIDFQNKLMKMAKTGER